MQKQIDDVIASGRIAPKPLLEPEGGMKKRIVLLGRPWHEPDSPKAIEGAQFWTPDMGLVIP
jgi:hypothetical protein